MSEEIKAIETTYNGYRFRSRLEARWAVFFDALGITYQYEPEGFTVDGECYLPDFYLPGFDIYAEVKPDTEQGRDEVFHRYPKFIRWGGKIKALLILSDIPKPYPSEDDLSYYGIYNFPILFYRGFGPEDGWFRFFLYHTKVDDGDDFSGYNIIGRINKAGYPTTRKSIYARSSSELNYVKYQIHHDENGMNELREYINKSIHFQCCPEREDNQEIFEALDIAYGAKFDHGQTPTNVALWKKYGYKKPKEFGG